MYVHVTPVIIHMHVFMYSPACNVIRITSLHNDTYNYRLSVIIDLPHYYVINLDNSIFIRLLSTLIVL